MKEKFEKAIIEIFDIKKADVITTSDVGESPSGTFTDIFGNPIQ